MNNEDIGKGKWYVTCFNLVTLNLTSNYYFLLLTLNFRPLGPIYFHKLMYKVESLRGKGALVE